MWKRQVKLEAKTLRGLRLVNQDKSNMLETYWNVPPGQKETPTRGFKDYFKIRTNISAKHEYMQETLKYPAVLSTRHKCTRVR